MLAGEWINFGDEHAPTMQMLNKLQETSYLEATYGTYEERLAAAKQIAKKRLGNKRFAELGYADDEIAGIFGIGKGDSSAVLDFMHEDEEYVGITRSPTAYGEFVYRKNLAKRARPLLEALGVRPQGLYVAQDDFDTLADADIDGDVGKVVTGPLARAMLATKQAHEKASAEAGVIPDVTKQSTLPPEAARVIVDNGTHRRLAFNDNMSSNLGMGSGSSIGERATQYGVDDPRIARYGELGRRVYTAATTTQKDGTKPVLTSEMFAALDMPRQWQKLTHGFRSLIDVSGIPNNSDEIYEHQNGVKVNLRALRDMKIDEIAFPSVMHESIVGAIDAVMKAGPVENSEDYVEAIYAALHEKIGYGIAGEHGKRLLQNQRMAK